MRDPVSGMRERAVSDAVLRSFLDSVRESRSVRMHFAHGLALDLLDARTELTSLRAVAEERRQWIEEHGAYLASDGYRRCNECHSVIKWEHAWDCDVPRMIVQENNPE